ncbi:hypothetical protein ABMA70_13140 [Halobacteriovorax sp. XZX-3]|uniref:hypothetical protein n=1 Tax=unclassified Halobacteriovorax TaxID=2639665 RepID=UPI000CD222A8|nr:hypothetical protein [Halobacteriovorax sp. DA5]POB13577.1 hypothetical protein C0Z22_10460 [Halobacteriovorax sp. DA5]
MIIDFEKHIENKTEVYSHEFGVGKVISIFKLYDGVFDYFEVQFERNNFKKFFIMRASEEIRIYSNSIILL